MVTRGLWTAPLLLVFLLTAGCAGTDSWGPARPSQRLTAFASEAELQAFLREVAPTRSRRPNPPAGLFQEFSPGGAPESVTNVQHAGVDEGGLVKVHGDYLVVLRRGRLFTLRITDRPPRPISTVDAFGPDIDPRHTWYDEMLVSEGRVVVVGYSYARGGTELGLFDLDAQGRLTYRSTYHLRSDDYYSARNYASRLLGQTLVVYAPRVLRHGAAPASALPALRRWRRGATASDFVPIHAAHRVFRPVTLPDRLAFHSVIRCDLARPDLTCAADVVIGPPGHVFYVSPASVYVWAVDGAPDEGRADQGLLYRLSLEGAAPPQFVGVSGTPVDQFSFLEAGDHLNVLVRERGRGAGMWRSEAAAGGVALLRLPLEAFEAGVDTVSPWHYRLLPSPGDGVFQNRFVGDHVLYGAGQGWRAIPRDGAPAPRLVAHRYAEQAEPVTLDLPHPVDRIEALGPDALIVGASGRDLHFSSIGLHPRPSVAARYVRTEASPGELRSHGFFYRADGAGTGIVGLPIRGGGQPGYAHLRNGSASVLFLRNEALRLSELGELAASPAVPADDGCRASCVDWYGSARPLFLRGRILALLGYEIVEGQVVDGRLREQGRLTFMPVARR